MDLFLQDAFSRLYLNVLLPVNLFLKIDFKHYGTLSCKPDIFVVLNINPTFFQCYDDILIFSKKIEFYSAIATWFWYFLFLSINVTSRKSFHVILMFDVSWNYWNSIELLQWDTDVLMFLRISPILRERLPCNTNVLMCLKINPTWWQYCQKFSWSCKNTTLSVYCNSNPNVNARRPNNFFVQAWNRTSNRNLPTHPDIPPWTMPP